MHILDDLYNGNINPCERFIKKGSEYQKLNRELLKSIEDRKFVGAFCERPRANAVRPYRLDVGNSNKH